MATMLDSVQESDFILSLRQPAEREQNILAQEVNRNVYLTFKYILDFCLASVLLVITGPIILFCALLVRLTSRGPAFYFQVRLGLDGRPFWIYKLRTMYHDCEAKSGAKWSQQGDPRITPLGHFLRRTHLDELPQLWNILRGEMSLIGPRPERPEFIPSLAKTIPLYEMRLLVRPGVTGLAQVQLPADIDLDSVRAKLTYDLYYVRHTSLWMDLRILAATGWKVFGASFALMRRCFGFPSPTVIERHYQDLKNTPPLPAELHPGLVTQ
jgi:lipopolysaccharide/colanic/teichoic acid biosynthesis glycosyltransferase